MFSQADLLVFTVPIQGINAMQIQPSKTSLFDYLNNTSDADAALQSVVDAQKNNIYAGLAEVENNLATGNVDDALERLKSGENGINLQTLDNMLSFNMRGVTEDLTDLAKDLGLTFDVKLAQEDGAWVVSSEHDPEHKGLAQLQQYLDRNPKLQSKLDDLNALSEFYELGQSQEYAKELQAADVHEDDVVTYLTQSREYLFSLDSFYLSDAGLSIASRGESEGLFEQVKTTLGLVSEED
ncbi:MAG: hypothetical protein CL578_04860 [Alteromonadaceae bacterium]|uniref:Uncharacterized protein n=3 Tax=Paraglaciecola chathamensis TaxID=368405 RepID=A0ABQ0I456_9ALTE|nr:hypothetical protein [Alteromonadaceae bacterium]GAC04141.1 hypothetical protein GAGA_1284 [Paraglaciecola agarilytica NO2]GAC10242.1 hypothetical protein GCHA_2295 [Paraglaciecola chathamensis S18K6]